MVPPRAQINFHTRPVAHGPDCDPRETESLSALAALAQRTRLSVFRLLLEQEPRGMPAGTIAETVDAPQNTVSAHLAVLARANLVLGVRQGRNIIYRANVPCLRRLFGYLVTNCCLGNRTCSLSEVALLCAAISGEPTAVKDVSKQSEGMFP